MSCFKPAGVYSSVYEDERGDEQRTDEHKTPSHFMKLWVIPAFGVHPQFENGLGKQFFGFSCWFVLVNVGQPLTVFYRMHSVAALMELLITAK